MVQVHPAPRAKAQVKGKVRPGFTTLLALGRETGHELVVPAVVADEATAHWWRSIEGAFDVLRKAYREARGLAALPVLPELPNPGELAREYRRELEATCRIAVTPDEAAP